MTERPTRETLLGLVDEMELMCKELVDNVMQGKKLAPSDQEKFSDALAPKLKDFNEVLKVAAEQGEIERQARAVKGELKIYSDHITTMQNKFKEAEKLLSTSLYQAKQKLKAIENAEKMPVLSEELIKYAHKISASNAVCAPLNWQQGDPRRPYPTDLEMRSGFLSRPETATAAPHVSSQGSVGAHPRSSMMGSHSGGDFHHMNSPFSSSAHSSPSKMHHQQGPHSAAIGSGPSPSGASHQGQYMWPQTSSSDTGHGPGSVHDQGKGDEVEVMSTDSSSSSSTDSN